MSGMTLTEIRSYLNLYSAHFFVVVVVVLEIYSGPHTYKHVLYHFTTELSPSLSVPPLHCFKVFVKNPH
jgi:hypothetical protein